VYYQNVATSLRALAAHPLGVAKQSRPRITRQRSEQREGKYRGLVGLARAKDLELVKYCVILSAKALPGAFFTPRARRISNL
jgi:hypothetical protein